MNGIKELSESEIKEELLKEADNIYDEDIKCNMNIGKYGNEVIPKDTRILTHCNAGALATAGYGTALGVIRYAIIKGKIYTFMPMRLDLYFKVLGLQPGSW